jgi:hypothetical protein
MRRLNSSSFAASAMFSGLSLGCSAKGRITASLCSATPQAASPAISHCCHFCIQIADKLRRERRPRFDYKRPLFQCIAVKKRTMLKIRVASPRIECSVTTGLPTSGRYERRGWHRLRPTGGSAALPGTAGSAESVPSQGPEPPRTLHSAPACKDTMPNNSEKLRQIILKVTG